MKKAYEKPEIKKVELRPEEAALTLCKASGSCNQGATTSPGCFTAGS